VGIRGAVPGDPLLERDLDACAEAGVGGILLFDVDVPTLRRAERDGASREEAVARAPRNILDPEQLRGLIDHLRVRLGEEILICVDQEGGRVARLAPARGFLPDPAAAVFAELSARERGEAARAQARQLRELGFDLNFAPCVDLALQPRNEVIVGRQRSYGRDPEAVIEAARKVVEAHAESRVAACLKHFPGHGSSEGDTHLGMVEITRTWRREEELAPYRALLDRPGVAVMVAHLMHLDLDARRPASLSPAFIEGLLRGELGFGGVVVTDSIDMRAIRDRYSPEEAVVAAIDAGADLVVDAFNLEPREEHPAMTLVRALRRAVEEGSLRGGEARIRESLGRLAGLRRVLGRES
jgi:beta-N-acetylhexosaminidase